MTGKRIWGLAATSAATLGMGFFLPRDLMQAWLRSASFYILFVLVLTWAFLMIRTYGGLALRLRRHLPALVTALGITVLVFTISPPRFKILADETNLIGVSLMMHETRTAAVPLEGVYTDYADPDVATTTVKRPMLFSFLTALLHAVIGYRAENGFILNFIVSVAVLWCFYLSVTRVLPNIYAIAGLLLLAAAPVYVMCATSSGFELLNMLLVVFVFLLLLDLEASGFDASRTELLLFSLVLLAHCRYEAIAVLLVVLPALAAPLWKRGFWAEMPWRVWLLPLFLLPVFWQRVLYWGTVEFNRVALGTYQQVESAFGWRNLLANFDDNLFVLMGLNPDYGFTPVLFALAAVGLYLWIRRKAGGRPVPVSTRWAFTALGVFVLLFLIISSFYWGNFGIPMDIRLSLVFLPFLCWSALYGVYCLRPDFHQRSGRRSASAVLLLLAAFHLLLYWPAGALQRPLQQLSLPYEYERVRDFLQNRYPDRGYTLLITDLPNLYLVQGYSALKINNTERLRSLLGQPNLFDRILVVQKFDRSSGEVLPAYRVLPANLRLHPVGSFALTSQTGIRISQFKTTENRKDTKP